MVLWRRWVYYGTDYSGGNESQMKILVYERLVQQDGVMVYLCLFLSCFSQDGFGQQRKDEEKLTEGEQILRLHFPVSIWPKEGGKLRKTPDEQKHGKTWKNYTQVKMVKYHIGPDLYACVQQRPKSGALR